MIKNSDLYSFSDEEQPDAPVEPVEEVENPKPVPTRLLSQAIVSITALIVIMAIARFNFSWSGWLRTQLHNAVNASSDATFGRLWRSRPIQIMIENGRNLVRLEPIPVTQTPFTNANPSFANPVWPVKGSVVKGFGWSFNPATRTREYSQGVEISALPDSEVYAVAGGEVFEVNHRSQEGWSVTILHGNGWKSVYHHLGKVTVQAGQRVDAGSSIGRLSPGGSGNIDPILRLEMFNAEQAVDPLSVL